MIPEVDGTRSWGPSRKRVPKCIKGPKTTYTTIAVAEKQSKSSKKGPFSLYRYWVPPGPTKEMELLGPGGEGPSRSTPVSPAMSVWSGSYGSSCDAYNTSAVPLRSWLLDVAVLEFMSFGGPTYLWSWSLWTSWYSWFWRYRSLEVAILEVASFEGYGLGDFNTHPQISRL